MAKVGRESRVIREKSLRFYKQALMEGMDEDQAFAHVIERLGSLGLTERKLRNYLENKNSVNPKADAITEARILVWFQQLEADVNETREECDAELAKIDEREKAGEDWYEVEEIEEVAGERTSTRTKKLPLSEARMVFLKRKADELDRYFRSIKAMKQDVNNLNLIGTVNQFRDISAEDLARRIREGEKRHQVEGGVSG